MFKLALDAGHGKNTAGKRCMKALDKNETREWVLNDRICDKIEKLLAEYDGISVKRVDDTSGKTDVALSTRTKTANSFKADLYLSIHHNAGINGGTGGGLIVIRQKGLSADGETGKIQKKFYNALVKAGVPKGNRATPTPAQDLQVLRETTMPAILIECGFMDSATDIKYILTDEFADKVAKECVNVIVELGKLTKKRTETPTVQEKEPEADKLADPKNEVTPEEPKPEANTDQSVPAKKSWVEVVKEVLKVILEWLKLVDTNK